MNKDDCVEKAIKFESKYNHDTMDIDGMTGIIIFVQKLQII